MPSMNRTIIINNIARLEGESSVEIVLDKNNQVSNAKFITYQGKYFEELCVKRFVYDLPSITARICGVCSIAHNLVSIKTIEDMVRVEIPKTAILQRKILAACQIIQSHLYFLFFMVLPDFVHQELVVEPEIKSFHYLLQAYPDLMKNVLRLKSLVGEVSEAIGGQLIMPFKTIPGGISQPLENSVRIELLGKVREIRDLAQIIRNDGKRFFEAKLNNTDLTKNFNCFVALSDKGEIPYYGGEINILCPDSRIKNISSINLKDGIISMDESNRTVSTFTNNCQKETYKTLLTGPLARVSINKKIDTEHANKALEELMKISQNSKLYNNIFNHLARLIEILYASEKILILLQDDSIINSKVRKAVKPDFGEGIGFIEAPRGLLFHYYKTNEEGRVEKVRICTPSEQNLDLIEYNILNKARELFSDGQISTEGEEEIKKTIRCFDPCINCAVKLVILK